MQSRQNNEGEMPPIRSIVDPEDLLRSNSPHTDLEIWLGPILQLLRSTLGEYNKVRRAHSVRVAIPNGHASSSSQLTRTEERSKKRALFQASLAHASSHQSSARRQSELHHWYRDRSPMGGARYQACR